MMVSAQALSARAWALPDVRAAVLQCETICSLQSGDDPMQFYLTLLL